MLYPRTLDEHDYAKELKKELSEQHSMLKGIPRIDDQERNKMINKVMDFKYDNTYNQLVATDIQEMVGTVRYELKDTLGIPRPRKVAAYKEAEKRIDKATKSVKH